MELQEGYTPLGRPADLRAEAHVHAEQPLRSQRGHWKASRPSPEGRDEEAHAQRAVFNPHGSLQGHCLGSRRSLL